jgi:hypothetical protein
MIRIGLKLVLNLWTGMPRLALWSLTSFQIGRWPQWMVGLVRKLPLEQVGLEMLSPLGLKPKVKILD